MDISGRPERRVAGPPHRHRELRRGMGRLRRQAAADMAQGILQRAGGELTGGAGHGEHGERPGVGQRPPRRALLVVPGRRRRLRRLRAVQLRRDLPRGAVPVQLRRALAEVVPRAPVVAQAQREPARGARGVRQRPRWRRHGDADHMNGRTGRVLLPPDSYVRTYGANGEEGRLTTPYHVVFVDGILYTPHRTRYTTGGGRDG